MNRELRDRKVDIDRRIYELYKCIFSWNLFSKDKIDKYKLPESKKALEEIKEMIDLKAEELELLYTQADEIISECNHELLVKTAYPFKYFCPICGMGICDVFDTSVYSIELEGSSIYSPNNLFLLGLEDMKFHAPIVKGQRELMKKVNEIIKSSLDSDDFLDVLMQEVWELESDNVKVRRLKL